MKLNECFILLKDILSQNYSIFKTVYKNFSENEFLSIILLNYIRVKLTALTLKNATQKNISMHYNNGHYENRRN